MNSKHVKKVLFGMIRRAIGQSNINAQELRGISIPVAPLAPQRRFGEHVVQALELEEQQLRATQHAEPAFQSLLAMVF
jgi:hypothetical protein